MLRQVNTVLQVGVILVALAGSAYPDVLDARFVEGLWSVNTPHQRS